MAGACVTCGENSLLFPPRRWKETEMLEHLVKAREQGGAGPDGHQSAHGRRIKDDAKRDNGLEVWACHPVRVQKWVNITRTPSPVLREHVDVRKHSSHSMLPYPGESTAVLPHPGELDAIGTTQNLRPS